MRAAIGRWPWIGRGSHSPPVLWLIALFVGLRLLAPLVAPGVLPADAGEFQLVARDLGVAHPPGYPLYTLAAHLFGQLASRASIGRLLGGDAVLFDSHGCCGDAWAWSVSLFSALMAVITLGLVYQVVRELTGRPAAGILGTTALALSPTFLAQATTANIRMPSAFFTALLLQLTFRWLATPTPETRSGIATTDNSHSQVDRGLVALTLVGGLAVGHHGSLAVLGLPIGMVVLWRLRRCAPERRTLAAMAIALAVSLVPQSYLVLRDRAGAVLGPGNLSTTRGFLEHITAYGFRGDVLYFDDPHVLVDRGLVLANILSIQFGLLGLGLAVVGALWLLATRRSAAAVLLGTAGLIAGLAITYRAPQTMEYLLPAYVAIAVVIGAAGGVRGSATLTPPRFARHPSPAERERGPGGEGLLPPNNAIALGRGPGGRIRNGGRGAVATLLIALAIVVGRWQLPAQVRAANPDLAGARAVLQQDCAPAGRTLLASWHYATPLWYAARHVANRPDLAIEYVYPEGAEPIGETWRRRLADAAGPVVVTNRSAEMQQAAIALWPVPGSPFFASMPLACGAADGEPISATFGDAIRLVGADVGQASSSALPVRLTFRAIAPVTETLTIVAQLLDADDGAVWGQLDHALPAVRWNDARGVVDRLDLVPFRGTLPARMRLVVGVYRLTPDGPVRLPTQDTDPRATVTGSAAALLPLPPLGERGWGIGGELADPVTIADPRTGGGSATDAVTIAELTADDLAPLVRAAPPAGAVPFGHAMTLVDSAVHRQGNELVVDLTWLAEEAYGSDYTISVQAQGVGWRAQHDGTPAHGAVPTLKWLPGMVVRDRHRMAIADPDRDPLPSAVVTVTVYDAFTLEPLPVTDGELVRRGQGQAVEIYRYP